MWSAAGATSLGGLFGVEIQFFVKPRACLDPIALDRTDGHAKQLGGLLFRQAAEEAVVDDLAQPVVDCSETIQGLINVGLARGWGGREKVGLMPIRGHSGVQGGAEVGCTPVIDEAQRRRFEEVWGFPLPAFPGLTASEMVSAAFRGEVDAFWLMGGNFLETLPDPSAAARALANVGTRIHQDVLLSSMMLLQPKETVIIFPATTRYESPGGGTETSTERRIIFSPEIPGRRIGRETADV